MNLILSALIALAFTGAPSLQKPAAVALKPLPVVGVEALKTMIPEAAGWTRGETASDVVRVSDDIGYSFVTSEYTNGASKIRLTIGDTSGAGDCLMALAAMISVLPQGYSETPAPATSITRFTYQGYEAASKWNSDKLSGEFSVLVGGRFVVKAEGDGVDTLDTLRAFASKVDFKKLAELKPGK
jgi:hypothetical protein